MRFLGRFGLGLCGLALVVGPAAKARAQSQPPAPAPTEADMQGGQAPGHHHKGMFAWRHCVDCQRAWAKKRDGVDVPPPPGPPPGVMPAPGVVMHNHPAACAACQAGAVVSGPVTIVESYPPGRAVVGGPPLAGGDAPGYAVVGGPEAAPAPVGMAGMGRPRWNGPRTASAPRPGAGPYDPSLLPAGMYPAQTALDGDSAGRPHVLGHLFGVSGIVGVGREFRASRERKARERHASISYDPPAEPVTELPASVVYGKGR